jgi:pyruvate/2-oxoglutarate dehydrogenase complex dihydrolipoamide dehydrogenase (E3) component
MEAARVARLRGHNVTLIERGAMLGGQLIPAAVPPHKEAIALLADYLETQLIKTGVKVKLGMEATPDSLTEENPEVIVCATGAVSLKPKIPGIEKVNVLMASDVLSGKATVRDSVVIIGAEIVGCETANYLAEQGKKVTLVRRGPQVLASATLLTQIRLLDDLTNKGVEMLTSVQYEGFTDQGLSIKTETGEVRNLKADNYILAAGARIDTELIDNLKERFKDVYVIGDAVEPRKILPAMAEGFNTAMAL